MPRKTAAKKQEFVFPQDKLPPQNIEAEESVLGSILIDSNAIIQVADFLEPDDFYRPAHGIIYKAMLDLYQTHQGIDLVTVSGKLAERKQLDEIGGRAYLASLANMVPTSSHAVHYANVVHKKRVLRDLISSAHEIGGLGWDEDRDLEEVLDEAEQKLFKVSQNTGTTTLRHIGPDLKEAEKRIDALHLGEEAARGIPTGFSSLNNLLSGLQKSNLVILAARPSLGKTALALDIARHIAVNENLPVAIFSLEMSREEVVDRLIAAQAGINLWKLRTGNISSKEDGVFADIKEAIKILSGAPLIIDDSPALTVLQIRTLARRIQAESGLALVIVDYLQLITPNKAFDSPVQQTTEISHRLKSLARELRVPVIAVSQLSRAIENRGAGSRPQLSDLRESGSIEQDADVVMFIHRPNRDLARPDQPDIAEIIIAKHRNGPVGIRKLLFKPASASFSEPTEQFDDEMGLQETMIETAEI